MLNDILTSISDWVWGYPLLGFLLVTNIILLVKSRFSVLKGFFHAFTLLKGSGNESEFEISKFKALSNALAATIGMGNIAGVAVAIKQGGPGAIFWMWIAAFLGMTMKFYECSIALKYRTVQDEKIFGGPMYAIDKVFGDKFKFLSAIFAICGTIGTLSLFQINQISQYLDTNYSIPKISVGITLAIVVSIILIGGVKRIAKLTSSLVPIMSIIFIGSCLIILFKNYLLIPALLKSIFTEAFGYKSVLAGITGYTLKEIIIAGFKRAMFSNEAGIGSAPLAHADSNAKSHIEEGYVAMLGPFWDTIVICTMTALVLLITGVHKFEVKGIDMVVEAFKATFGASGTHILGISVFLFSFSTLIGMANYNYKCFEYLFSKFRIFTRKNYVIFYAATIIFGSTIKISSVINLMDIAYGLMCIPNIFLVLKLSSEISKDLTEYNKNL